MTVLPKHHDGTASKAAEATTNPEKRNDRVTCFRDIGLDP